MLRTAESAYLESYVYSIDKDCTGSAFLAGIYGEFITQVLCSTKELFIRKVTLQGWMTSCFRGLSA